MRRGRKCRSWQRSCEVLLACALMAGVQLGCDWLDPPPVAETAPDPAERPEVEPADRCIIVSESGVTFPGVGWRDEAAGRRPLPRDRSDKVLYRPVSEDEIGLLAAALTPIEIVDDNGNAIGTRITGPAVESGLTPERMSVLVEDIASMVIGVQMQEMLARLNSSDSPDPRALAYATEMSSALEICARRRYEDFGGGPAYDDVLEFIRQDRKLMETVLSQTTLHPRTLSPDEIPPWRNDAFSNRDRRSAAPQLRRSPGE